MNILVPVKEVTELTDSFTIESSQIDDQLVEYTFNEWDEYALESAVTIAEAIDDVAVTVVTIGPERAEETLRTALAKGADHAMRIWDDSLDTEGYVDVTSTADILAAVVEQESPDLVLTGVQAADTATGATGVYMAQQTEYTWASVVNYLDLDQEAERVTVHRELEGGTEEIVDVQLPAVLTIQTGINEPRYASLRGIRQAQRTPIDTYTFDDLDLDSAVTDSAVERVSRYEPTVESTATIWEGDPAETAGELASVLRDQGVGDA